MSMDADFMRQYKEYKDSLDNLTQVILKDYSDSFNRLGIGATLKITFDLACQVMKLLLTDHYCIRCVEETPREILRTAFKVYLIDDDKWMQIYRCCKNMKFDFKGEEIGRCGKEELSGFIGLMKKFDQTVNEVIRGKRL